MTTLKLYGGNPRAVQAEAAAFLESLSGQVPEITAETDEGES